MADPKQQPGYEPDPQPGRERERREPARQDPQRRAPDPDDDQRRAPREGERNPQRQQ